MFSPLQGVTSHRLPNGLRIFLKEDHDSPLVSAHAWVRVGSADEEDSSAGLSHVLEHMVFKGTAHHRAADISRWVESLGGGMNAETSREYTHYYIDTPSRGADQSVHLLGELLYRAQLDAREWKRECPVILEEMKRRHDDADAVLWELLNEALFDDPRWRRPVIGSAETVSAVDAPTLARFYRYHYVASRCVVVVVGDFRTGPMLARIRREFSRMPRGTPFEHRSSETAETAGRRLVAHKPLRQAYAAFGFVTPPSSHADHEVLDVLAAVLGEGRESILIREFREAKKLAWSISASNLTHEGPGLFGVFAECEFKKLPSLAPALQRLWKRLLRTPPSDADLSRAKHLLQTGWLQGYESYHNQAATIGSFALENHLDRLRRYLPRLLSVTRRDIHRALRRYFRKPMASAVVTA